MCICSSVGAGGGIDDTRTGLGDADSDGTGLSTEVESGAEMAGSESRADVAPKDGSAGIVGDSRAEVRRMIEARNYGTKAGPGPLFKPETSSRVYR